MAKSRLAALILTIGLTTMTMTTTAHATGQGPCSEPRYEVGKQMSDEVRIRKVKALIRCVFDHLGLSAQIPTAYAIAQRESGFRPWATNPVAADVCRPYSVTPYGSCGVFQHLARYWPGRVRAYLTPRWFPHTWPQVPVLQERANVLVTAKIVKARGWCDWTPPYCG